MNYKKITKLTAKILYGTARRKEKRQVFYGKDSEEMLMSQWKNPEKAQENFPPGRKERVSFELTQTIRRKKNRPLQNFINRYAAAITLLLLAGGVLGFLLWFDASGSHTAEIVEKHAPRGEQLRFTLPDGSQVWLNADSKLQFPEYFSKNERRVELTGEAFFKVKHQADKPFMVKTSEIDVEVLGTEFNVSAYPDNPAVSTTLKSGKVKLYRKNPETGHSQSLILSPGQKADFIPDRESFIADTVNTLLYTSWIHGKLIFDNRPLREIIPILERQQNIDIKIDKSVSDNLRFTMTLTTESPEQIFKLMCKASNLKHKKKEDTFILYQ